MPFELRDAAAATELVTPEGLEQETILGMEASQFRFISSLFIGTILSPLFNYIHTPRNRHLYSLIPGLLMSFYMYKIDAIHPLLMATYFYLITKYIRSNYMPHIFFTISMLHLTYGQIYRYKYLYLIYTFDWTASTMLMAFKLAGAAWAIRDGRIIARHASEEGRAGNDNISGSPPNKGRGEPYNQLTAQQKELAFPRDLTPLEAFGLAYFFPGFTSGPYPEAKRYVEFVERTGAFAGGAPNPLTSENRGIRQKFAEFVVSAGIFVLLSDTLNEDKLRDKEFLEGTNIFERIGFMILAVNAGSCKYYIVWSLGELGHILSGVSYNGVDKNGKDRWDGCLQMDLKKFYTFKTCREVTNSWNKVNNNINIITINNKKIHSFHIYLYEDKKTPLLLFFCSFLSC